MRIGWRAIVTISAILGVLVGAVVVGVVADGVAVDDNFVIDRFDRQILVEPDGTTRVIETIDVTFRTERRGIFRDLPEEVRFPAGGYEILSVDQGDVNEPWNYARERLDNGDLRIRIGEASTWLRPGSYRYRLTYLAPTWTHVQDRDPSTTETRIDVPGFAWPTTVGPTTLTLIMPGPIRQSTCVSGRLRTVEPCPRAPSVEGNVLRQELGPFAERESATVSVIVDTDRFTTVLPTFARTPLGEGGWLRPWNLSRTTTAVLIAVLLLLPLGVYSVLKATFVYRDRVTDPALHDREYPSALPAPPHGFRPPEVAGLLLRRNDNELFLSTLVDLDQRGLLTSRAEPKPRKGEALVVLPPPPGAQLPPQEREFVGALLPGNQPTRFDGKYDAGVAHRVTSANRTVTLRRERVFQDHGYEHAGGGVLRNTGFKVLLGLGYLAFAAAVVLLLTSRTALQGGGGVAVAVITVLGFLVANGPWIHHKLPLNSEGRDAVAQARAFREFLATVEGEQLQWAAGQPGVDHHHPALSLLPYAIALGLADSWFKRFGSVMRELAVAAGGGAAAGGMAWYTSQSSFGNVRSSQSSTTTAPSSSGGGGGGGGSGGGGGGGGSW